MDKIHFSSKSDEWETPADIFAELDREFHFTLDPASTDANAKCAKHFTAEQDGLSQSWAGEIVFLNPPYGRAIGHWIYKAATAGALVVCLIPARTDTAYWHRWIFPKAEIRFLPGRLKFTGAKHHAPFPSAVVIFRPADQCKKP